MVDIVENLEEQKDMSELANLSVVEGDLLSEGEQEQKNYERKRAN